jgi:nitrogen-specific signal transduction histidine kinase/DNA-binding NarL/FixJ family response regulator
VSHFLFIRNQTSIPTSLREVFSSTEDRIIIRHSALEAESALTRGVFDAVIIYSESDTGVLGRTLREVRDIAPEVYIVVLATSYDSNSENETFANNGDLYLAEPIPVKTLKRVLLGANSTLKNIATAEAWIERTDHSHAPPSLQSNAASTLHVLRDLSHILSYSLDYQAFTQQFILKLRDHISFSRIGIFLERSAKQSLVKNKRSKHLSCIASLGLPSDLIDCFQLSREVGIGREISEQPRILRKKASAHGNLDESRRAADKEFTVLGCQLAIPITDRENVIGLAVINGPVTGRDYTEDELELLYLLMEELGLAIRNSRLHSELAQHGQLIENVMHSMTSGAIVFGEDLEILYINDAAKRFLEIPQVIPQRSIELAELPAKLTIPVHRAVEKGELPEPFQITGLKPENLYQVSIFPFTQKGEPMRLPRPTMVILEDFTKIEANKESALADTKSEMIGLIAERFAHEIRNSLVPLSTHAQLIDKKIEQPKFQASLKSAMLKETARIKRFSEQMLYLAQSSTSSHTDVILDQAIESAFARARLQISHPEAQLVIENEAGHARLDANSEALTYAFEELFINAMQAEPGMQKIRVQIQQNNEGILCLRWRDGGPGLGAEIIEKATEPFYTTRHTGVGLGLSVAQKVITEHNGYLRLNSRSEERDWDIEIELPSLLIHA